MTLTLTGLELEHIIRKQFNLAVDDKVIFVVDEDGWFDCVEIEYSINTIKEKLN